MKDALLAAPCSYPGLPAPSPRLPRRLGSITAPTTQENFARDSGKITPTLGWREGGFCSGSEVGFGHQGCDNLRADVGSASQGILI